MGIADVLKPQMPKPLSITYIHETCDVSGEGVTDLSKTPNPAVLQLTASAIDAFTCGTIGTNPETLFIALESEATEEKCREAFAQLINSTSVD